VKGGIQLSDLYIFEKVVLRTEDRPVKAFQAIEKIPLKEIIPEKISEILACKGYTCEILE